MTIQTRLFLPFLLAFSLSCEKENGTEARAIDRDVATEVIAEFIDDDIEKIVLSQLFNFYHTRGVSADAQTHQKNNPYELRTGCALKSTTNNNTQVIIDYGAGCRDDQKRVRAGKIIANLSEKSDLVFGRIDIILENYYYESVSVTGSRTILVNTETARQYAEITSTVTNGLLSFDDGSTYTYNSQREVTWDFTDERETDFYFLLELNKSGIDRAGHEFQSTTLSELGTNSVNFASGIGQMTSGQLRLSSAKGLKILNFKGGTQLSITENDMEPYSVDLSSLFINR